MRWWKGHYASQGYSGIDAESEDERLVKRLDSVDYAMNTTEYVRGAILFKSLRRPRAMRSCNNKLKTRKDNEDAEAATE